MNEIWKPILGFEGYYSASSTGRIRSEDRIVRHYAGGHKPLTGTIISPWRSWNGYLHVCFSKENVRTRHAVHRLVLSAFTGPMPRSIDCRHKDGSRDNNCIENLEWGTRSENMQDAVKHGKTNRGIKNPMAKLTPEKVLAIRQDTRTQVVIGREYGVDPSVISNIRTGKLWSHV